MDYTTAIILQVDKAENLVLYCSCGPINRVYRTLVIFSYLISLINHGFSRANLLNS